MIVFSGRSSTSLGSSVADGINAEIGKMQAKKFPDGEIYIKILSNVRGKECTVIQSTASNDDLVELIILLDLLRDLKADRVHTVVPYLGYARQDKRFDGGEALSSKTILKLIDQFSDSITTLNCHFLDREGEFNFEGVGIKNLDAFPLVAGYFKNKLKAPVLISPDEGALEYAKRASEIINCEFDYLEKTRISDTEVKIKTKELDVSGKDVIILDDMISTGSTIIEAGQFVRAQGAGSVNVGCIHGVFSRGTEQFRGVVDELVCTDTISTGISSISVAGLISKAIKG